MPTPLRLRSPCRRVWGQRPGQPGGTCSFPRHTGSRGGSDGDHRQRSPRPRRKRDQGARGLQAREGPALLSAHPHARDRVPRERPSDHREAPGERHSDCQAARSQSVGGGPGPAHGRGSSGCQARDAGPASEGQSDPKRARERPRSPKHQDFFLKSAQPPTGFIPIDSREVQRERAARRAHNPHHMRTNVANDTEPQPVEKSADAIRVLIVDDHALFRRGLQMVLEQETDIAVVGEAGDGQEAVEKAGETMPDVVLMDVRMPKRGGIEATKAIKELMPHIKILMLTISDEEADLYDAIKAGATGYLLKEVSIEEVGSAIRSVQTGQSLISPSMASKLLSEFATMVKRADEKQTVPQPRLTDREMEVLKLVAKGRNNRDIAKELFISENTVKNHIRNILEKLHLHSRMEAVVYAVREKLLEIK